MKLRRFLSLCLCVCFLLSFFPHLKNTVSAAASDEIGKQIEELESQEEELQAQIDALELQRSQNANEISQIVSQKQLLDQQITLMNHRILLTEQKITALKQLIADYQDQYDLALTKYEALSTKYIGRVRTMEEQGSISYWSILFRANSFTDFLDRLNMIREIAAADRKHLRSLSEAAAQVDNARTALQTQQSALQESAASLQSEQKLLDTKRQEADSLLRQLAAKAEEFEKLLDESEQAQQELLTQIAKKKDEFDKAAYAEWLAANPTAGGSVAPPDYDEWLVPVPHYTISSVFGMRLHPVYGEYRMHQGIDMACAAMTPIYAARGGQVEIAVYSSTAGNYVQINHGDGYRSVYMHMTYYTVRMGEYVAPGQLIGYVGNTGVSRGDHLHFGISYNGTYINPYPFIAGK